MNTSRLLATFVAALLASQAATAGVPASTSYNFRGTAAQTRAYAGLNWSLGGGATPSVVLGVMQAKVRPNGDTEGANLSLQIHIAGGVQPGKLKLAYLNGRNDLQGELGGGYDLKAGKPLVSLGANGPHLSAGGDLIFGLGLDPYLTLHTLGKFDKPDCVQTGVGVVGDYPNSNCTGTPF